MLEKIEYIRQKLDVLLLFVVVVEFQLFGTVWAMMNVSGKLYLLLYWGFVALALAKLCIQKNSWKEWILILILMVLGILSWRGSDDKSPLLLMLGVCISKEVDLDKLLKVDLVCRICNICILILFPLLGICENMVKLERGINRYYFGWQAPGAMGLSFLIICIEWMYFRHGRFKWFDYAGIAALLVFLDRTANSRSSEMLILGILCVEIFTVLYKKMRLPWEEYQLYAAGCITALVLDLTSFAFAMSYHMAGNDTLMTMDRNFFSRFSLPRAFLDVHGWTLLGSPYDPEVYDYLDISFAYLSLHLGILIAVAVFVLFAGSIVYGWKKKDVRFQLVLLLFLLRSIVESDHFTLLYAPLPIVLGIWLWHRRQDGQIYE